MATRKSGDGAPQAPESKVEQRPGSYAQISSSRRKRKGKKQRNSRPSEAPVEARSEAEQTSDDAEPAPPGAPDDKASVPVDDLRAGRVAAPSNRAARRAIGPLGMADQGVVGTPPDSGESKAKLPSQPRVKVVEINPAELVSAHPATADSTQPSTSSSAPPGAGASARSSESSSPPSAGASARSSESSSPPSAGEPARSAKSSTLPSAGEPVRSAKSSTPPGSDEPVRSAKSSTPPSREAAPSSTSRSGAPSTSDPTSPREHEAAATAVTELVEPSRAHDLLASASGTASSERQQLRPSTPGPTWGADELALAELDQADLPDELGRPSLSSVFDARPSLRPSPAPAPEKSSPALVLVVSLLCAIIATAGVVALREAFDDAPAPRAPRTATSAPVADIEPAARTETEVATSPPVAPAFEPSIVPALASGQAKVDASVVQPMRRVVRAARPPIATPVAAAPPAGPEVTTPSDTLPENPYNEQ